MLKSVLLITSIICIASICSLNRATSHNLYDIDTLVCPEVTNVLESYNQEVRAIIGEASNQGYKGMLDIASGIRNRGNLKGVYGVNAKHVDNEPEYVWELARKAWRESEHHRTHTGNHWENVKAFGKPYWADDSKVVHKHKDHVFYKL